MVLVIAILFVIICFGLVVIFGAPYLPTLKPQIRAAFELAELKKGQTILELGCGDGRVLVAAAKKGYKAVGYELNPLLALLAWLRCLRYRRQTKVIWGNYWHKQWPEADALYVFLLQKFMSKLDKKCMQYPNKPIKVVSFAFKIPNKKEQKLKSGVYLYKYN
jgi:16S rRNA A1518/A1519 N6-dimethyltransferase RsmA/KsgA/DIM1 with predicted DNA glycosylase/AP lyase activity